MDFDPSYFLRYKETLLKIIHMHIPQCKIYLFGSRARGDARSGADIDLAINAGQQIDTKTLLKIYGDIEQTTIPVNVDVVDMHSISLPMRLDIEKEGIVWAE